MKRLLIAAMLAALAPSGAAAQDVGDWVLSRWDSSPYLYPGVVQSRHGSTVNVRFDDGSIAPIPVDEVRGYDWRIDTAVECKWTDGGWYAARITGMGDDGTTLNIVYEDGVTQRTNTGRCRSR